ncbi:MAG: ankyrin repeat domain-containing protein [Elusimicrobiota bacterium]|jgi:ankyrin repeat protein|nr:ankyrin repeat domain-containing protein [Elusimicrobiota bacterium]
MEKSLKIITALCLIFVIGGVIYLFASKSATAKLNKIKDMVQNAQTVGIAPAEAPEENTPLGASDFKDIMTREGISREAMVKFLDENPELRQLVLDNIAAQKKLQEEVSQMEAAATTQAEASQTNAAQPTQAQMLAQLETLIQMQDMDKVLNPAASAPYDDREVKIFLALMEAIKTNDYATAKALLDNGAPPNSANNATSVTPLFAAISTNNPQMVALLLDKGASRTQVDEHGHLPMHEVAIGGENDNLDETKAKEVLQVLIDHGFSVNQQNADGKTPLMLACEHNRTETARFLLLHKASKDLIDRDGQTVFDIAKANNAKGCEVLLSLTPAEIAKL